MVTLPNCRDCRHYFITHDPGAPYGCRGMGFKSKTNPARVVYESSGVACQLFSRKENKTDTPGTTRTTEKK